MKIGPIEIMVLLVITLIVLFITVSVLQTAKSSRENNKTEKKTAAKSQERTTTNTEKKATDQHLFCPRCGNECKDGFAFCLNCGFNVGKFFEENGIDDSSDDEEDTSSYQSAKPSESAPSFGFNILFGWLLPFVGTSIWFWTLVLGKQTKKSKSVGKCGWITLFLIAIGFLITAGTESIWPIIIAWGVALFGPVKFTV